MECYHPENKEWTLLPQMKTGRSGSGVAALNHYIYVVGGFDGRGQLATVERYDTENQVWESVSPIKIARSALSLTVLDGKLYAMGGFDGHSFLSIVEVYDPTIDKWEEHSSLTSGRSGHASAVIYQPSCASIYMECMEAPLDHNKKPPNAPDEDESKRGPNTSKNSSGSSGANSSNVLHSFSGNRCNHCEEPNQNPSECDNTKQQKVHTKDAEAEDQSKYEMEYRKAICSLLRMDYEEKKLREEQQRNKKPSIELMHEDELPMEVAIDEETNDYDTFENDNPKKYRRKMSYQSDDSQPSESSNSMDSFSTGSSISDRRNRQCSFSKLRNRFRQNINDFVAWSSSTTASSSSPSPAATATSAIRTANHNSFTNQNTAQDSINNNATSTANKLSKPSVTEERKCDLLKRYYKCKLKS